MMNPNIRLHYPDHHYQNELYYCPFHYNVRFYEHMLSRHELHYNQNQYFDDFLKDYAHSLLLLEKCFEMEPNDLEVKLFNLLWLSGIFHDCQLMPQNIIKRMYFGRCISTGIHIFPQTFSRRMGNWSGQKAGMSDITIQGFALMDESIHSMV